MKNKTLLGVLYVSAWVAIWGTVGSLIDFPLLKFDVYLPGTLGQYITFSLTGLVSTLFAIRLFNKIMINLEGIE